MKRDRVTIRMLSHDLCEPQAPDEAALQFRSPPALAKANLTTGPNIQMTLAGDLHCIRFRPQNSRYS